MSDDINNELIEQLLSGHDGVAELQIDLEPEDISYDPQGQVLLRTGNIIEEENERAKEDANSLLGYRTQEGDPLAVGEDVEILADVFDPALSQVLDKENKESLREQERVAQRGESEVELHKHTRRLLFRKNARDCLCWLKKKQMQLEMLLKENSETVHLLSWSIGIAVAVVIAIANG